MNRTRFSIAAAVALLAAVGFWTWRDKSTTPPVVSTARSVATNATPVAAIPTPGALATAPVATNPVVPAKPEFRDQTTEPMRVVYSEDQRTQLNALEKKLNALSGRMRVIRQEMATAKFTAVRQDVEIQKITEALSTREKTLRTAIDGNPAIAQAKVSLNESKAAYAALEQHLESIRTATGALASATAKDIDCAICRKLIAELPAHGPTTHETLAGVALEQARLGIASAAREVMKMDREIRTNDAAIASAILESKRMRADLDTRLAQLPAVAALAAEEARLMAEHQETRAQCAIITKQAAREPLRLAHPLEQAAGGSGT